MEKIRAFLAFEVSKASKDWIEEKKREIMKRSKGAVRWVKRDNEHVTLHFFGSISEETIQALNSPLNDLAERSRPFHLKIDGVGGFPNRKTPRVLWAGLADAEEGNIPRKFHADLCALLEREKIPVEKRPYVPHVTFGRVKKKRRFHLPEEIFREQPECDPFWVREIVLFQSNLTPEGPIYRPLNRFLLGGKSNE